MAGQQVGIINNICPLNFRSIDLVCVKSESAAPPVFELVMNMIIIVLFIVLQWSCTETVEIYLVFPFHGTVLSLSNNFVDCINKHLNMCQYCQNTGSLLPQLYYNASDGHTSMT